MEILGKILECIGLAVAIFGGILLLAHYNAPEHRGYFKRDIKTLWKSITRGNNIDVVLRTEFYHDDKTGQQRFIFEFYLGRLWYVLCWLALIGILCTSCRTYPYDPTRPDIRHKAKKEQQKRLSEYK